MCIVFLAVPGVQVLDVSGPMDVFSEANDQIAGREAYAQQIVGLALEPVTAKAGTRFIPDLSGSHSRQGFDMLLVAGSPRIRDYDTAALGPMAEPVFERLQYVDAAELQTMALYLKADAARTSAASGVAKRQPHYPTRS